jgi:hypothetical protein
MDWHAGWGVVFVQVGDLCVRIEERCDMGGVYVGLNVGVVYVEGDMLGDRLQEERQYEVQCRASDARRR